MNIIFLDFDGVIHTEINDFKLITDGKSSRDKHGLPLFDPKCIRNLEKIIQSTEAKIVVTSSWRGIYPREALQLIWKERHLPGEIIDVTPIINDNRGDEIDVWLSNNSEYQLHYIIIDDLTPNYFNPHHHDKLFVTNPLNGITNKVALNAIRLLKNN